MRASGVGSAERRLAEIELLGRAGDVLMRQQRIQRHQEIQIEAVKAHCLLLLAD